MLSNATSLRLRLWIQRTLRPSLSYTLLGALSIAACGSALAQGTGTGSLVIQQTALNFGTVVIGTPNLSQTFTISNEGLVPVTVTSLTATNRNGTSDFKVDPFTGCPLPLQLVPQASCTFSVDFLPTVLGTENGTVMIVDSTAASPETIGLGAIAVAAVQELVTSSTNITFSGIRLGATSATKPIVILSDGTLPVTIGAISVSGDFAASSSQCAGMILVPNDLSSSCEIDVSFTPTAIGMRTGTLTIMDSASGVPQLFSLMGTGSPARAVPPSGPTGTPLVQPSLDFGSQQKGITSPDLAVSVYNPGPMTAQVNSLAIIGKNARDFAIDSIATTCTALPLALAAPAQCQVSLTFTPSQVSGTETAQLVINTAATNLNVLLSGIVADSEAVKSAAFTPRTMAFDSRVTGSTSGSQYSAYLTNTGTESITFQAPLISGPNASDFQVVEAADPGSCLLVSLDPDFSCNFFLQFTPTAIGAESAVLTVDGSAGPVTMALSGQSTAVEPSVSVIPATIAFDLVAVGVTSNAASPGDYIATISNNSSSPVTLNRAGITAGSSDFSIATTGQPTDTCSGKTLPALGAGISSCQIALVFAPSAAGYRTGQLNITDSKSNVYSVALAGYGFQSTQSAIVTPQGVQFPTVTAGTAPPNSYPNPPYKIISLSNTGTMPLSVGAVVASDVSGDFSFANPFGYDLCSNAQLAPGGSCQIYVEFTPSTSGLKSSIISFPVTYSDNTTATLTASAKGYGGDDFDAAEISPSAAVFPDQGIGQSISTILATGTGNQTGGLGIQVLLLNDSSLPVTVGMPVFNDFVTGASAKGDFVAQNPIECTGASLPSIPFAPPYSGEGGGYYGACAVNVFFVPQKAGIRTGRLVLPVTFADGKTWLYAANFTGRGVASLDTLSVTPASINFNPQIVGQSDSANVVTVTVTNTGNETITFSPSTLNSPDFSFQPENQYAGGGDVCGRTSILPHTSCTITVMFTPQAKDAPGAISGTLTINDSSTGSPHVVGLSGTALAASQELMLSQSNIDFAPQAIDTSSAPIVVYLINQGSNTSFALKSVELTPTSASTEFTETDTCGGTGGTTLAPLSVCEISVVFHPTSPSAGTKNALVTVTPVHGSDLKFTITGTETVPEAASFK